MHELIQGCIDNDRASQNRLYTRLSPGMMVVCLRYARSREEAEEILQEGFLQVFKSIKQYKGEGAFEGWVRKIMVNTALQKLRIRTHLKPIPGSELIAETVADKDYILPELSAKELIGLIQQLSPMYRAVFNLYVFEGFKHREIAAELGISEGTSKSNLSDARNILQKAVLKSERIAQLKNS